MSDLVEILRDKTRLRAKHGLTGWVLHEESLRAKAADEIDALRARVAELEDSKAAISRNYDATLREFGALRARVAELEQSLHDLCFERAALYLQRDRLRAALEDAPPFGQGGYFQWYVTTRREALDGPER